MGINFVAVLVATVAQFIIGAIWYMPIFGTLWSKIHGHDKLSKEEQKAAQKNMLPLLGIQLVITLVTTVVLAKALVLIPSYSPFVLAGYIWIGFVVPTQIAAIIFGGTKPQWFATKAAIMAGGSLACLVAAAAILNAF